MARKYSNTSVETTLVNSINSSETSIQINDTGGLPATFPYSLIVDFQASTVEVVTVTNLAGGTLTVTRGQDGTAAQSHDAGAVVVHGVTARDLSEPQVHIDNTDEAHGVGAGSTIVGTNTVQTLTNKTISGASNTLSDIGGSALTNPLSAATVDATFNSVTLAGPDPDINVATELTSIRTAVDNGIQLIHSTSLASPNSTIFIPDINQDFQRIRVVIEGRHNGGQEFHTVTIRFNADFLPNYFWVRTQISPADSTAPVAGDSSGATGILIATGAQSRTYIDMTVYNYATAQDIHLCSFNAFGRIGTANASNVYATGGGGYTPTVSITEVRAIMDTDSWVAGTTMSIYGMP